MSSERSIRHLAKRARLEGDEALRLLAHAGYRYSSPSQLVAQGRLADVEAALGLRPGRVVALQQIDADDIEAPQAGSVSASTGAVDAHQPLPEQPKIELAKRKKVRSSTPTGSGPLRHQYDLRIVGRAPGKAVHYLDSRAVLDIHEQLVRDFAGSADPIEPAGPRGRGELLESAITRPRTSLNSTLKYPTIEMAAAALLHALVHDHPFHNGNKRTAIVALLVFLDQNGYVLEAEERDLFDYVLDLAGHGVTSNASAPSLKPLLSDEETIHAAQWIATHARKLNKRQNALKWKDLEGILRGYDCTFDAREGNSVAIRRGNLTAHTGRRNSGDEIDATGVAHIRKQLQLDEQHGVDSSSFYYNGTTVPQFINSYRQLLKRLAAY